MLHSLQSYLHPLTQHILLLVGIFIILAFYAGKVARLVRLPSLIGFIVLGVLIGPSLFNIIDDPVQGKLSFITDIALGFVALSIGLELNLKSLRKLGSGIISIILAESFGAFLVVFTAVYLLTRDYALALIFGAIAPASAPAGTVAIIREYRAKGTLTQVLYAVVGFDDGLGVIIFGIAAALARNHLVTLGGGPDTGIWHSLTGPVLEIGLSLVVGAAAALGFSWLGRKLSDSYDISVLVFGLVLALAGLTRVFHLSLILTVMTTGLVIVNTQPYTLVKHISDRLPDILPLLFILFFTLAGANLHIAALPSLGVLGGVYILARSAGLMGGAWLGGTISRIEEKIRKYVGLGILSQAGLAIGLALIVKHEFKGIGPVLSSGVTGGDYLGATVITTVTATCIIFEIAGPILTKIALTRAGEIDPGAR